MGVSSCPMIGSYRPLRQTGKNSVCIRRIVCIRLSYQSGGCKSVESSFTGRALETSSKIEDCKGSPSLERGDGPATAARKEVLLLLLQAKAGRQKDGRPLLPFFLFCYCCFLWQQQRGERSWVVGWSSARAAAWRRAMEEGEGLRRSDGEEEQEEIKEVLAEAASPASAPHLLLFLPSPPPPLLLLLLLLPPRKAGGHQLAS